MRIYTILILVFYQGCQPYENSTQTTGDETTSRFGLYGINQGNQDSLICYHYISQDWIKNTQNKFPWDSFDTYDNRVWVYLDTLFRASITNCTSESGLERWKMATRPQKVVWAFQVFDGQTDNGGVSQFLFNYPEFSIAALEAMRELKLKQLEKDYRQVLTELTGESVKVENLIKAVQNNQLTWDKKWEAFQKGYQELPSTTKIKNYYYSDKYKKELYIGLSKYMEDNLDRLVQVETK